MSIVNVVESPRRVVMLTDASLYDENGVIIEFTRKAIPVDSWNGVISFRGNAWGLNAGHSTAERFASFDEFLARSAPEIERDYRAACASGELRGQTMVEIHVAAWSEREHRARAFSIIMGAPSHCSYPQGIWLPTEHFSSEGILTADLSMRAL